VISQRKLCLIVELVFYAASLAALLVLASWVNP
jgi:hypothetical protein